MADHLAPAATRSQSTTDRTANARVATARHTRLSTRARSRGRHSRRWPGISKSLFTRRVLTAFKSPLAIAMHSRLFVSWARVAQMAHLTNRSGRAECAGQLALYWS
jgi:hypothetical protein